MSHKCPKCESEFPKAQRNTIPYAICDWGSIGKLFPSGTRVDANMFCVSCNTNFVATKESFLKLVITSYTASALILGIIFIALYTGITPSESLIPFILFMFLSRILVPRIAHNYITVLEEAPMKDVFDVSIW